jgi:hypothetical protein
MNRDELALETEHLDLLDRLAAAKVGGDKAELAAAKAAIHEFRAKWRTVRAAFKAAEEGTATPETVTASSAVKGF